MRLALIFALLLIGVACASVVNGQLNPTQAVATAAQTSWSPDDGSRAGDSNLIGTGLFIAGFIGVFVSYIYFIVRAFSVSAVWGVFVLLFNGIAIPLFCLFQFERARRPLGILLLSLAAIVGGAFLSGGGR